MYGHIREGFELFGDCKSMDDCSDFKEHLKTLFTAIGGLQGLSSQFLARHNVDLAIDLEPIQTLLDHAPPFSLFVMRQALNKAAPKWRDSVQHLAELQRELEPLIELAPLGFSFSALEAPLSSGKAAPVGARACTIFVSSPRRRTILVSAKLFMVAVRLMVGATNELACKKDFGLTGEVATVGAGTTLDPSGCRGVLGPGTAIVNGLIEIIDAVKEGYDRCETLAFRSTRIESSLAACESLVSLMLPRQTAGLQPEFRINVGGELDSLVELVELRTWQINQAKGAGSALFETTPFILAARMDQAAGEYGQAYQHLCDAYESMQLEAVAPRNTTVPPIETSGNVNPIQDGETIPGTIRPRGDQDVISFEVPEEDADSADAAHLELVNVSATVIDLTGIEMSLAVFDPDNDVLSCDSSIGRFGGKTTFSSLCSIEVGEGKAGKYHIVASDNGNNNTGKYELTLKLEFIEP